MTRREMIRTSAAAVLLGQFIRPAPRRIDLAAFCSRHPGHKFDLTAPYIERDWTYATDSRVCVRVAPLGGDTATHIGKVPPFDTLAWDHDTLRGWRALPNPEPLLATDSDCPACEGYGSLNGLEIPQECEHCSGTGDVNTSWEFPRRYVQCRACKGEGIAMQGPKCPACRGKAIGVFPALVRVDDRYFDAALYAKVQRLGGEYIHAERIRLSGERQEVIKFRFDGGDGFLMGILPDAAQKRIAEARA